MRPACCLNRHRTLVYFGHFSLFAGSSVWGLPRQTRFGVLTFTAQPFFPFALAVYGGQSEGGKGESRTLPLVRQNKVGGGRAPANLKGQIALRNAKELDRRIVWDTRDLREVSYFFV